METFTRKFLSMSRRLISKAKIEQNHRAIMEALSTGDVNALDRAIRDHMRQTSALLAGDDGPSTNLRNTKRLKRGSR